MSHCHYDLLHTLSLFLMNRNIHVETPQCPSFPAVSFNVEVLANNNMIWEYNNMIWEIEEDCSCAENKHNYCLWQSIKSRILKEIFLQILK